MAHGLGREQSEKRIRVALAITELDVGGAERCLVNLATGLDRRRFEPRVFALAPRPAGEQGALVERLEESAIPIEFVGVTSPRELPRAVSALKRMWSSWQPEVVQSFLFHADVTAALALIRRPWTRLVMGFRVADPSRWRQVVRRHAARRADRVVCVSNAVASFAQRGMRIDNSKLVVIHNGVDPTIYQAATPVEWQEFGVAPGRQVLLCVARLHRQKGLDWLLSSLPPLLDQFPNHDVAIAGMGPDEHALRGMAKTLRIADRVHFLGWQSDLPRLLRGSRLLVLTSRWEGLPNAILEAMAAGIPIVAARTDGVSELLGEDPLQTFPQGDAGAFRAAVECMLVDDSTDAEVRERNRQRAASQFSLVRMVQNYSELFDEVVNRGVAT